MFCRCYICMSTGDVYRVDNSTKPYKLYKYCLDLHEWVRLKGLPAKQILQQLNVI